MRALELAGQRFGRLTVIERAENIKGKSAWLCRCDCGNEIIVSGRHLNSGNTRSCGCYRADMVRKAVCKHEMSHTKLSFIWVSMKQRCSNPNDKSYENYGGRGIKVCDEWKDDFQAFYDHVSKLANFGQPGYSIDRIDNNGNYEPGNVKWSTSSEQSDNRRKTVRLTFNGQTHTLKEWSKITSISLCAIQHRYYAGKPVEEILRR